MIIQGKIKGKDQNYLYIQQLENFRASIHFHLIEKIQLAKPFIIRVKHLGLIILLG